MDMSRKRQRRRASDIANIQPKSGFTRLLLIGVGRAVIIIFKLVMSDETAEVFKSVVGDPELVLPQSALERNGEVPIVPAGDAGPTPRP